MKLTNNRIVFTLLIFIYFCLIYLFSLSVPIHIWDEARNGMNAFEMHETKNYFETTFYYNYDNWNTKPPLLIWLICIFINFFGYSLHALRLPSIISLFLLTIIIVDFLKEYLKLSPRSIYIYVISFLLCPAIIGSHSGFFAEYEPLLLLFQCGFVFSMLKIINSDIKKNIKPYIISASIFFFTRVPN